MMLTENLSLIHDAPKIVLGKPEKVDEIQRDIHGRVRTM